MQNTNSVAAIMAAPRLDRAKFSHKIYKNDPLLFRSYVDKSVSITTENKNVLTGVVYTVDPVSESVVLVQPGEDGQLRMEIVVGRVIEKIEVISERDVPLPELFRTPFAKVPRDVIAERKKMIAELLSRNRFPVTEDNNVLHIEGVLRIEPPYHPENCVCTNEIILSRVQSLISSVVR